MNEDRHGGNWGIHENAVAPLFDHNYAFGGPDEIKDINQFMQAVTSAFYVVDYNKQRYDALLMYFVKCHSVEVAAFMEDLNNVRMISNDLWNEYFPRDCERLNAALFKRMEYMREKAGEYNARLIDDNEF
jgi:protoheme ferro-lyase